MVYNLNSGNSALIIIDMQNDFCHQDGFYGRNSDLISPLGLNPQLVTDGIPKIKPVLEAARQAGFFIAHTQIIRDSVPDAVSAIHEIVPATFEAVSAAPGGASLEPGSWGSEIHDELKPLSGEYIVQKRSFSAFYGTDLEVALRRRGITTVILVGTITYACVLHTAFDANVRDFDVIVASDSTLSWDRSLQEPAMRIVDLIIGKTQSTEDIIKSIKYSKDKEG
jgi:ureidoacrylate peracid hydrolase